MSTKKITALTELAAAAAATDMIPVVDVSDTTDAATGTTKKITATNIAKGVGIGAGGTTAEPVKIDTSSGNVGIGAATPIGKLSIENNTATNYATHVTFNNTSGSKDFAIGAGIHGSTNNGFGILDRDSSAPLLYIDNDGLVGIGTATPGGQMEVEVDDAANVVGILVDQNDTTNNPYAIQIENAGSGDSIRDDSGAKLTAAGVFTDASDQFKKKNVSVLNIGLAEVLRLKPKKFKYKKDNSMGVGFLAQDIEKIIPEIVHGDNAEIKDVVVQEAVEAEDEVRSDKGEIIKLAVPAQDAVVERNKMVGGKSVAYGSFTAVLVKAIQELSAKVTALENA